MKTLLAFMLVLSAHAACLADIIVVDWERGSDETGTGSWSSPYATIQKGCDEATPGDEVRCRPGAYSEKVTITVSGTEDQPITIRGWSSAGPTLDGTGVPMEGRPQLLRLKGNWLVLRDFEVRDSLGAGIGIAGNNCTVTGNIVTECRYAGITCRPEMTDFVENNRIVGNQVYVNCKMNKSYALQSGWPSAIGITAGRNCEVSDNDVHSNYGEGINVVRGSSNCVIAENEVHDNYSVNIYLDSASWCVIRDNLIYETNTDYIEHAGKGYRIIANGVSLADEREGYGLSRNNRITDNIIYRCRRGITYQHYEVPNSGVKGLTVTRNAIIDCWDYGIKISDAPGHVGSLFQTNVISINRDTYEYAISYRGGDKNMRWKKNVVWVEDGSDADLIDYDGVVYPTVSSWNGLYGGNISNNVYDDPVDYLPGWVVDILLDLL